jgi:SAM-dependent methyltransferase
VFTHLSEAAFLAWTKEMARVVRPGGTLLFTVLGDFAMAALAPGFPRVAHERWRQRGIYDDSGNAQLETIGVTGATYRNTWVKRSFVEKALGSDFELVDYVRPFHFYQDLVVARRR